MFKFLGAVALALMLACTAPPDTGVVPVPVASSVDLSQCLVAEDINAIRAEWNADSEATEAKYVGQTVCVSGDIQNIRDTDLTIYVGTWVGGAAVLIEHWKDAVLPSEDKEYQNRMARELAAWLEGKQEGDPIKANCPIDEFISSDGGRFEVGTPDFGYCELVKE